MDEIVNTTPEHYSGVCYLTDETMTIDAIMDVIKSFLLTNHSISIETETTRSIFGLGRNITRYIINYKR